MEKEKKIVKSTESGRLYIKTSDFFKQEDVRSMIDSLMDSSIFKSIKERKQTSQAKIKEEPAL